MIFKGRWTMKIGKIYENKIQCKKCGDIIESKTVHDMKWCKCGAVAVDGGTEYLRRSGYDEDIIELSKYDVEEE